MKSNDSKSDNEYGPRAAAHDRNTKTGADKTVWSSPAPAAQRKHTDMINNSPYITAQQKQMAGISGHTVQKQPAPEEEELLQGKLRARRQAQNPGETVQAKIADSFQSPEEEELRQGKFAVQRQPMEEEEPLQGKSTAQFKQTDRNKTGMPDNTKARMEDAFAADFSDVRVHANSTSAKEVGALAYTQGTDIHFAPGQFKPDSPATRQLLGHELTHVVQQRQGRVQPTGEIAGMPVNDSPTFEKEADEMGKKTS